MVNFSIVTHAGRRFTTGVHVVLLIIIAGRLEAVAQEYVHQTPTHATTYDWSVQARLQLLDETHAYNEQFYDRGFARVYTPLVKREYELDNWMHGHQFNASFNWYQQPKGYRMRFGSYSKGSLAMFSQLHMDAALGADANFLINFYPQQHARGTRALIEIGYEHTFNQHRISLNHTLSEFKQDLDLTLSYKVESEQLGHAELDVTVMNYLNNLVNTVGNDDDPRIPNGGHLQTTFKTFPIFFSGRYRTPKSHFYHLDVSFGVQPQRRDAITDKGQQAFMYEQKRGAGFVNASVDVRSRHTTTGLFFYADRDHLTRSADGNPFAGAYRTTQQTRKFGGFVYGYMGRLRPFIRFSRDRYTDTQDGDDFSISVLPHALDHAETRWVLDVGIKIQPFKVPFYTEFRYMSLKRDQIDVEASRQITKSWTQQYIYVAPFNNRLVFSMSFVASNRFHFEMGGAYDIDGDTHQFNTVVKRFDKGFVKMLVRF
ncbi:MAG: hypothetical protein AAF564_18850 [Bacteroidota bacterium]